MDGYDKGAHCKYSLKVHIILVTKYRKRLFVTPYVSDDVKQYLFDAASRQGCRIIEMETDDDHVHMLLSYGPGQGVAEIVGALRQYSTYQMWRKYSRSLRKQYWKREILWSDGYFACSVGKASQKTIEHYIRSQG